MARSSDRTSEDASSVLRAIGSLLVALSGNADPEERTATQRLLVTLEESAATARPQPEQAAAPPPSSRPQVRPTPPHAGAPVDDEIEFILQDARERAQQILEESTERARALIRDARARDLRSVDQETVEELRESMSTLLIEIRDVQHRLTRIETLITTDRSLRSSISAAAPVSPRTPEYPTPTSVPAPQPAVQQQFPPVTEPAHREHSEPPSPVMPPPQPTAATAPSTPPPAPARSPAAPRSFSVVPPAAERELSGRETSDYDAAPDAPPPSAVPRLRYASPAPADDDWMDDAEAPGRSEASANSGAPIATFMPGDGPITLRVTPVAGFQGLMRIQDALARLPAVRQAAVEAYSQGEARLRLELLEDTDSDELAAGLSRALRNNATVQDVSESGRQLLIALN